jgi:hypothetical protein
VEIRNILNSGYKKYGKVFRTVKTSREHLVPKAFEVFSPKAFVTYLGLEDITEDRSINIVMIRTINKEIANREINDNDVIWQDIRDALYVFALGNWKRIKEIYENLPNVEGLESRFYELWKPILALAKFFGDDCYEIIKNLAIKKILEDVVESRETTILRALVHLVQESGYYKMKDIIEKVKELEGDEKWVNKSFIGRTLSKSFGFKDVRRSAEKGRPIERFIDLDRLKTFCKRYGIDYESELSEELNEEATGGQPVYGLCEICHKREGKLILRDNRFRYICDECAENWEGKY